MEQKLLLLLVGRVSSRKRGVHEILARTCLFLWLFFWFREEVGAWELFCPIVGRWQRGRKVGSGKSFFIFFLPFDTERDQRGNQGGTDGADLGARKWKEEERVPGRVPTKGEAFSFEKCKRKLKKGIQNKGGLFGMLQLWLFIER